MNDNISEWEELVAKIRQWDRREHDWATRDTSVEHKTRISKESFIKSLMRTYDLKKK
jgi:hypothetical protein